MVFRWGGEGMYSGRPSGPHHVLIHHGAGFLMPVEEIENCLSHLDPSKMLSASFWTILDHESRLADEFPTSSSSSPEDAEK